MEELKKFTDEELHQELKRRKNQKHEIKHIIFDATIKRIGNINHIVLIEI